MKNPSISKTVSDGLALEINPIAIKFVNEKPSGIQSLTVDVPSACTLWRKAEKEVFFAAPEKHFNCPIGAMTMGFEMPESVKNMLGLFVQKMCDCNYLSAQEPEWIPTIKKKHLGVVYGPLASFPLPDPDLILMWLNPSQVMIFDEAAGLSVWSSDTSKSAYGRPACSCLPAAVNSQAATHSFGCKGMRTFTEIDDNLILTVLPGNRAIQFCDKIERTRKSNSEMEEFYLSHKKQFASA